MRIAFECLCSDIPKVVAGLVDPVSWVVFCARPAVAEDGEAGGEGVDEEVAGGFVFGCVAFHPFKDQFVVLVGAAYPGVRGYEGGKAEDEGKGVDHSDGCCDDGLQCSCNVVLSYFEVHLIPFCSFLLLHCSRLSIGLGCPD